MIEKIPYLQELGVTAVELLPVFEFDEREVRGINPIDGSELRNFWGYDPYLHFSPQASYCVNPDEGSQITEFRDMVKALHKAGIEVILDVVFNHTGRGQPHGPDDQLQGPRQRRLLPAAPDPAAVLHGLLGLREHGQREPSDRAEVHPRLPALLGRGDARRRLPLRRGLGAAPRRRRRADGASRRSSGASSCPRSSPTRR